MKSRYPFAESYRKFNPSHPCPKCGGCVQPKWKNELLLNDVPLMPDTLRVTCGVCGFAETFLPLDTSIDSSTP